MMVMMDEKMKMCVCFSLLLFISDHLLRVPAQRQRTRIHRRGCIGKATGDNGSWL